MTTALKTSTMDVLTAIRTRRSIRRYTADKIDDHTLDTILDAGFCAPSASNKRPWHFLVIREKAKLQAISEAHPYAKMMPAADCCIVVCGDEAIQGSIGLLVEDCSASIQNMLLAAHGLGIGAVWCGLYGGRGDRHLEFAKLLGLPAGIVTVGMIAFGYPDETRPATDRFDASRVHHERW
ncbi:MAG: nitroreductase family protein [Bacillota bacterium]|nr:nitroreductase family protein [Bacillota bacterium]